MNQIALVLYYLAFLYHDKFIDKKYLAKEEIYFISWLTMHLQEIQAETQERNLEADQKWRPWSNAT